LARKAEDKLFAVFSRLRFYILAAPIESHALNERRLQQQKRGRFASMPIYEYQCQQCKHRFEAMRKISDEPLTVCPACGKATLKKLISKAAFRLKGGGWYETDFKSDNKKNLHESGEAKPGAEPKGGEKKEGAAAKETKTDAGSGEKKAKPKPEASAAG
jgi:putative FmdB family regulatory protein